MEIKLDVTLLQGKFGLLGARVKVDALAPRTRDGVRFTVDVQNDKNGEYFDLRVAESRVVDISILDVRPEARHLLLMAAGGKFLCGHDERHWFAAAVPGAAVSNVKTALEALKPPAVRFEEVRKQIRPTDRLRRKNAAFVRQGEWFFVPRPDLRVNQLLTLRREPLSRGAGSKPHMCEYLYRTGGQSVYVCRERPNGITEAQHRKLVASSPRSRNWDWRVMRRDMQVYARGRVWHPDHKTVHLALWHQVFMNTENQTDAMRHVVFLD